MLKDAVAPLATRFAQRAVLFVNHLLSAEPAARARLESHAGRRIEVRLTGARDAWLPAPFIVEVSRAGLLDADVQPSAASPDLRVAIDVGDPLTTASSLLAGRREQVSVAGDAALAADIDWLVEHLRWDLADDLEPLVGAGAARALASAGSGVAAAARGALDAIVSLRGRRPAGR